MKSPISVRSLSDAEQKRILAGLRSSHAFVLRRCQMLLVSGRGKRVPVIAGALSCDEQTVRNAIHAFHKKEHNHSRTDGLSNLTLNDGVLF
jgi:DNA-binding NarL/FixJ family response regulator